MFRPKESILGLMKCLGLTCGLGILFGIAVLTMPPARAASLNLNLETYATGLNSPIDLAWSNVPGDGRFFVAQLAGKIRVVEANGNVLSGSFLDLTGVPSLDGEDGLLGLTFDPDYASNGYFYVYYTNQAGDNVVVQYRANTPFATSNTANPNSARTIITIPHPGYSNHNGGTIKFGPDGYLYIATGDGGAGNDPPNNAQNKDVLLGKLLRLDVNPDTATYTSPAGNPYLGATPGRDEIWAIGLRNPFRWGFDRATGDIWIGDVGQAAREEINFQAANAGGGQNYGWRCYEGSIPNPTASVQCLIPNRTDPLADYVQTNPRAVTGGVVYRGTQQAALTGHYFFNDFYTGNTYTLARSGASWEYRLQKTFSGRHIISYGENEQGEVIVADLVDGNLYRLTGSFSKPWSANWVGQSNYPTIGSGEEATVYLDYRNTGTQTWTTSGANPVRLATSRPTNHTSPFFNSSWLSPNRPTTITGQVNNGTLNTSDTSIEPGEVARFQFKVVGFPTNTTQSIAEYFQVVADGATFMEDQGVNLITTVQPRSYQYTFAGQTYPPAVMAPGQSAAATLDLTNTGTATWRRGTLQPVNLGTARPRDRISSFFNGSWPSQNRLVLAGKVVSGNLVASESIAPGETARFSFNFVAPSQPGFYREYFEPVADGFSWLGDIGIFWPIYVTNPTAAQYDYEWIGQSAYPSVSRSGQTTLKLQLRNTGTQTWTSSGGTPVRLATDRLRDRASGFSNNGSAAGWLSPNRVKLTRNLTDPSQNVGGETAVDQGEIGEFEFAINATPPANAYREHFTPVVDGVTFMKDIGIFWVITII